MSGVPGATLAVANAVNPIVTFAGYVFTIRLNGQIYADVVEGWARMPATGLRGIEVPGVAMSHDSSIHLASCSKEICHAALLAMVEDWSALEVGIRAGRNAPASPIPYVNAQSGATGTIEFPTWLLPALADRPIARQFLAAGLQTLVELTPLLGLFIKDFADGLVTLPTPVPAQPGFIGLLQQIAAHVPAPTYETLFMSLIGAKLRSTAYALVPPLPTPYPYPLPPGGHHGPDIPPPAAVPPEAFTLKQLATHETTLHLDTLSQTIFDEIPSAVSSEPAGGKCTFNLWPYIVGVTLDTPNAAGGYNNNNYTVLGAVIASCTGMAYDEYAIARLFIDPRFSTIRTSPTTSFISPGVAAPPTQQTIYYAGAPNFGPGVEACDYTGHASGAGCFFGSGSQLTDWLYAVYSCDSTVASWSGTPVAPLSQPDSTNFYTSLGPWPSNWDWILLPEPTTGWTILGKSGGTSFTASDGASGSANTVIAIAISPDQSEVMTAFFGTNCGYDGWSAIGPGLIAAIQYYQSH